MITLNNLSIEDVKLLFTTLDFYHGMYPDNDYYKEQVERIESLLAMLQSTIEENETTDGDCQVPLQFCQYGGK